MTGIYKTYKHNPPHLFRPNAKYFITGATYQKKHYLESDEAKAKTIEYMFKSFEHFGWTIEDWILLNNHYHLMADAPEKAETLGQVINNFHKYSALWIKKNLFPEITNEKIWHNYWDTCITYEKSYFSRINYIWFNAVKHQYVEDAKDWKFGSFYYRFKNLENVKEIVEQYPYDRLNVEDDF